jgi:SAM-dependent methyltransferase
MGVIQREMDRSYWDGMAKGYEDEIFSVLHNDRQGLIRDHIRRISSPQNKLVADVGCGIGHCLALLADHFKHVYAIDISRKLLKRARQSHGHRANIDFHGGDIVSVFRKLPAVDCVVSVNSLISSSGPVRERMLKAIARCLKPQGHLVLVVPSLESALLVDQRFAQWKRRLGTSHAAILHSVYPAG